MPNFNIGFTEYVDISIHQDGIIHGKCKPEISTVTNRVSNIKKLNYQSLCEFIKYLCQGFVFAHTSGLMFGKLTLDRMEVWMNHKVINVNNTHM